MKKQTAIRLLGGTLETAAAAIGTTHQAISQWSDELTPMMEDRVQAALYRMEHGISHRRRRVVRRKAKVAAA